MRSFTTAALLAAGACALVAAAWLSPRVIPYNMDEFVHYHALGCAAAPRSSELPVIRDGCGYYDLRLPFTSAPLRLRSYLYIGSLPALPFYPLWRLVNDPVAVRLWGALLFLLAIVLLARLARVGAAAVVVASLVFPVWLLAFVVDEGPVGLSAVLLLVALHAARRALAASGTRAGAAWAAAAGLALFLGLWTKLVFAWWLPAFAVLVLEEARRGGRPPLGAARERLPALAAFVLCAAVPTALLLASADRDGRPYLEALRHGGFSAEPEDVEAVAARLSAYLLDGSLAAPRNLLLPHSPIDALPLAATLALLALAFARSPRRRELAIWSALAALTFALVAASGHSRWPHHFAFPLLPLVAALALALDSLATRGRLAALALVVAFWASLASRLPSARVPVESSADKDRLLAFVRERGLDEKALQVHASWGTYYIAQLFGDRERMIVYARRVMDDPARLRELAACARRAGRPLLLLSSRRFDRLHTPGVAAAFGPPRHAWQFGAWRAVEYDPPAAE